MPERVHTLRIQYDTVNDCDRFWNVTLEPSTLLAIDAASARILAEGIARLIDQHTINSATIKSGDDK